MEEAKPQPVSGGKGRGNGRKRGANSAAQKAAVKKATGGNGRRGRFKRFSDPRVQAAYERNRDLKANFSLLAAAVKPFLEELADRSTKRLKEDEHAHEEAEEYDVIQKFLNDRLKQVVDQAVREQNFKLAHLEKWHNFTEGLIVNSFKDRFEEHNDDFLDAQLNRAEKLGHLQQYSLPVDLPDNTYEYQQISEEDMRTWQAPYFHMHEGKEVPYPLQRGLSLGFGKFDVLEAPPSPKRHAEDELDGQPPTKTARTDAEPRHIAGILSAVAPPEETPTEDAPLSPVEESKGASPAPGDVADEKPAEAETEAEKPRPQDMLPPIPSGASELDAFGFRTVKKRNQTEANNRLIAPTIFEFDDNDIGFRDSTNDQTRGATVAKRGKFLNKPNSRNFHFDAVINRYDARQQEEGDLDQELVRKHKLHPRYGIFMPESENPAERPRKVNDGQRPKLFVSPSGEIRYSSRSVPYMKLQTDLALEGRRDVVKQLVLRACEEDGIDPGDIAPDPEMVELYRAQQMLLPKSRMRSASATVSPEPEESFEAAQIKDAAESVDTEIGHVNSNAFDALLAAAIQVEKEPSVPATPQAQRQPVSRPYDAIRDVFTDGAPSTSQTASPQTGSPQSSLGPQQATMGLQAIQPGPIQSPGFFPGPPLVAHGYPQMPQEAMLPDGQALHPTQNHTFKISFLAEVCEDELLSRRAQQMQYPYQASPQFPPPGPYMAGGEMQHRYGPDPNMVDPRFYQNQMAAEQDKTTFLQTALNPHSGYAPIAPAPPMHGMQDAMSPQGASQQPRGQFAGPGVRSRSPSLPSLRPPTRTLKPGAPPPPSTGPEPMATSPEQMAYDSPRSAMVISNSGGFYLPGPARPFHHPYTPQEQPQQQHGHMIPGQHLLAPAPPMGGPMQMPTNQGPLQSYPPPPQGYHGPPQMPQLLTSPQVLGPPLHVSQQQHSPSAMSPAMSPTRGSGGSGHRNSLSSGSNASAGNKYRKLEPAPLPVYRAYPSSNSNSSNSGGSGSKELRTVHYDYREGIKDYSAVEPPPQSGPKAIRGWTVNKMPASGSGGSSPGNAAPAARPATAPARDSDKDESA